MQLITLENLNKAKELIEVANASQLKEIISRADALRVYAKQAKKGLEIQNQVAEIKIRAERKMGELLKSEVRQGQRSDLSHDVTSLKELGVNRMQSSRLQQMANIPEDKFEEQILEVKTRNKELTTAGIQRFANLLKQEEIKKNAKPVNLPEGEFDVILADPPWKYSFSPTIPVNVENHYPTMDVEEICSLQLPIAKDAVLFLWATNPKLKEALQVMEAWGFEYKTNACWDKQVPTHSKMGYWFYGQHELLLVGTKGKFSPPSQELRTSSLYSEKKTKHSRKPDYFHELIQKMFPNRFYLELFARRNYNEYWTVWGNEISE